MAVFDNRSLSSSLSRRSRCLAEARTAWANSRFSNTTMLSAPRGTGTSNSKFDCLRRPSAVSVTFAEPTRHLSSAANNFACRSGLKYNGIRFASANSYTPRSEAPASKSAIRHLVTIIVSVPLGIPSSRRASASERMNGATISTLRCAASNRETMSSSNVFTIQSRPRICELPYPNPF